jgi:uncharacterized protein (TIGR02996 family)
VTATTFRDPDFEARLDEAPGDQGLRLVYADLVADHGDESYERALRWMAANGKWPLRHILYHEARPFWMFGRANNVYYGDGHSDFYATEIKPCLLPVPLFGVVSRLIEQTGRVGWFDRIGHGSVAVAADGFWCGFESARLATEYLARALEAA